LENTSFDNIFDAIILLYILTHIAFRNQVPEFLYRIKNCTLSKYNTSFIYFYLQTFQFWKLALKELFY